eukprot:CAMPEP_0171133340 /NCGR_PEP_ID=MMETSP0766_2-20121228/126124_1 /TAXON_ID=439317 /ORGANISM="Gambierdiscus australes, Strain CAWD 149" /LENGTH=113 /DNA_ID=CAMNT_0011596715 /DNA_START=254 /DNA_END=595 /DNA_ORIENTATION=+
MTAASWRYLPSQAVCPFGETTCKTCGTAVKAALAGEPKTQSSCRIVCWGGASGSCCSVKDNGRTSPCTCCGSTSGRISNHSLDAELQGGCMLDGWVLEAGVSTDGGGGGPASS